VSGGIQGTGQKLKCVSPTAGEIVVNVRRESAAVLAGDGTKKAEEGGNRRSGSEKERGMKPGLVGGPGGFSLERGADNARRVSTLEGYK